MTPSGGLSMVTVDILNLFLSLWLKPMIFLACIISLVKNTYLYSAASSHWLLSCALTVVYLSAVLWFWLPSVGLPVLPIYFAELTEVQLWYPVNAFINVFSLDISSQISIYAFSLLILGTSWMFFFQLVAFFEISKISKRARPVDDNDLLEIVDVFCKRFSIKKTVEVRSCSLLNTPVMWRYRAPIIILPGHYKTWPQGRIQRVLAHELAHISRSDWPVNIIVRCVCALLWWVPLVWLVAGRIAWFAELACDDKVIDALDCRAEYAEDLLELSADTKQSGWTLSFVKSSRLFDRIRYVLDGRNHRQAVTDREKWTNLLTCVFLIAPLSVLQAKPIKSDSVAQNARFVLLDFDKQKALESPVEKKFEEVQILTTLKEIKNILPISPTLPRKMEQMVVKSGVLKPQGNLDLSFNGLGYVLSEVVIKAIVSPHLEIKGLLPRVLATPIYPRRAIARGVEGKVIVQFDISERGDIVSSKIIAYQPTSVFNSAVLKALDLSKFDPVKVDGRPIITKNVTQTFIFTLYRSPTDNAPEIFSPPNKTQMAEF